MSPLKRALLLSLPLVAVAPGRARAEDECSTDEECVELYADGFVCVDGSLGRYCVERGCLSDSDCRDEYGSDSWCETWGAEGGRCTVPDPPKYVPPFRSICSVSAGRPPGGRAPFGAAPLLLVLASLLLGSRRLRG